MYAHVSVYAMCVQVNIEVTSRCWIPGSYRKVWVAWYGFWKTELVSSERAADVPNDSNIFFLILKIMCAMLDIFS